MENKGPLGRVLFLLVLFMALAPFGCQSWSERGAKGVGLLPAAPAGETHFSPYQPANPYQQLAPGLLGRKLHATGPEAGTAVEVHDFLVGPNQKTGSYTLRSTALFEIRSGDGILKIANQSQTIKTGTVLPVPSGQPFTIENQSDVAIGIRVEVLGGS